MSAHQTAFTNSKEHKLEAFVHPSSQGQDMETEKEPDEDFCDRQNSE